QDRLGVIGVNGSGKSTLLKVLAGLEELDSGRRVLEPGRRVGYLPQNPVLPEDSTVRQAVYASQSGLLALFEDYQAACRDQDLKRLDSLALELEHAGFHELETRAAIALTQLGLAGAQDQLVGALSGGQRRRVALAQALTYQPDLLLLDEPTNHLDTDAIVWL